MKTFRFSLFVFAVALIPLSQANADLIGHWKLDENSGSFAADSSTYGNDATLTGNQTWVPGVAGSASDFPGGGANFWGVTLGPELPTGAEARTITGWINTDTFGDRKFFGYGTAGSGLAFNFTMEGNGVRFRHGGGNITYGSVLADEWTHVAVRVNDGAIDTGDVDVFINGMLAPITGTANGGINTILNTPDSEFRIGSNFQNNSFDGSIDDVQFYDTALTDAEILQIFNNPGSSLNDLQAPVPEPAALALWSLLGIGLAVFRRRRR